MLTKYNISDQKQPPGFQVFSRTIEQQFCVIIAIGIFWAESSGGLGRAWLVVSDREYPSRYLPQFTTIYSFISTPAKQVVDSLNG